MHRGFRRNNEESHKHSNGNKHPVVLKGCKCAAHERSGGQKAHVHCRKENYKSDICIYHTYKGFCNSFFRELEEKYLEHDVNAKYGRKRQRNLFRIYGECVEINFRNGGKGSRFRNRSNFVNCFILNEHRHKQNCQNRTNGTKSD